MLSNLRLHKVEIDNIVEAVLSFDKAAKVFVFGSRTNLEARGGDIDLLILSEQITFSDKVSILVELEQRLREQKIDILIKKPHELTSDAFVKTLNLVQIS